MFSFRKDKKDIFHHVSKSTEEELVQYLQSCPDVDIKDKSGDTPIMAAIYKSYGAISFALGDGGIDCVRDMGIEISCDNRILRYKITDQSQQKMAQLIKASKNLNTPNNKQQTALMVALRCGDITTPSMLIKAGANIFLKDDEGFSAFDYAREKDNDDMVDLLTQKEQEFLTKQDNTAHDFLANIRKDLPRIGA